MKPRVTVEVPFGVGMACGVNPSSTPRSFAHRAASGIATAPEEASPPFSPLAATRWISPACRYTSVTIVP